MHRIFYKNSRRQLFWQSNPRNAVKAVIAVKKFSLNFTAFLTKIQRKNHRISYKKISDSFSNVYLDSQEI